MGSNLRWLKSIYYDPKIRELLSPDSSHPKQATQVSAQPKADQVPPAPSEVPKSSNQDGGKEKRLKLLRARIKIRRRRKILLVPQRKPQTQLLLSLAKLLIQWTPRQKLRLGNFYCFCMLYVTILLSKECITYYFFIINENTFSLFHTSL